MATKTEKSANDTSFHNDVIRTTVNSLVKALGEPRWEDNSGDDKVNFEWNCETEDGDVFTIYDWKEYRTIGLNEQIEFHLGGHSGSVTKKAKRELIDLLR
jgi:hypothetical protein